MLNRYSTLKAVLALSTSIVSSAAIAQSVNDQDFRYMYVGPGNVELKTGRFSYDSVDLSVGAGEFPSRLEFKRVIRSTISYGFRDVIGQFTHNFNISLGCAPGSAEYSNSDLCDYGQRAVRIGGMVYLFTKQSNTWVSNYSDGAQLLEESARWVFRKASGEQIIFPKDSSFYNHAASTHLPSLWEFPNGDFLTFQWEIAIGASYGWNPQRRLSRVVNSRGYGFKLNYLLPGGGTRNWPSEDNNDYRKKTVSSVEAIAPGCATGTTISCSTEKLGVVNYNYTNWSSHGSTYQGLRLDSVQHPDGNISYLQWTSNRALASESNPASAGANLFQNQYVNGGITQQTDPLGKVWQYRRYPDASGNTATAEIEASDGKVTRYGFSPGNYAPDWIEDPYNKRTDYTYYSSGLLKSIETSMGKKVSYEYDGRGNVTSKIATPDANAPSDQTQHVVTYAYPACDSTNWKICNRPSSITDERLGVTEFAYSSAHGGVEAIVGPGATASARPLKKFGYSTFTRAPNVETSSSTAPLADITLPTEVVTCLSSDGTATYACPPADSIKTTISYDASTPSQRTQFLPNRLTIDPSGINAQTTFNYDIVGNVVKVDGPRSDADVTEITFDKIRRVTREVAPDPDGPGVKAAPEITYEYDAAGNLKHLRRRIGTADYTTSAEYNAANQPTQIIDPVNGTVSFTYDDLGRPKETSQIVDGTNRTSRKIYDDAGRLTHIQSAVGVLGLEQSSLTIEYDDDGNVTSQTDAKGNVTSYCLDGYGRVKEARFPSTANPGTSASCASTPAGTLASSADFEAYSYDAAGNVISVRRRDGQTMYHEFNAQNRIKFKDAPGSDNDVTYLYDLAGRMSAANLSGVNAYLSLSSQFDKLGRVVSTTSAGRTLTYGYDASAGTATLTWPDAKSVTYKSDTLGRINQILGIAEGPTSPVLADYEYDQLSRRTSVTFGNTSSIVYGYDTQYRLSSLEYALSGSANDTTISFSYNEAGQIKTRTNSNIAYAWTNIYNVNRSYDSNGLNQYTQSGALSLTYDGRGNLTGDGSWTFSYDVENRMTGAVGSNTVSLAYDALGRLARVTANGTQTSFLYDGGRLVGEYDATGALRRRFVHGVGVDAPIVTYEDGVKQWLYADQQGSILAVADSGGNTLAVTGYGPFGEPNRGMIGRFAYTGQMRIPELGLYYYKARMYSASLGRFMQTDPIGYGDGMNWYNYVGSDPINGTDPTGTECGNAGMATPFENATNNCGRVDSVTVSPPVSGQINWGGGYGNASGYLGSGRGGSAPPSLWSTIPRNFGAIGAPQGAPQGARQSNNGPCTGNKSIFASIAEGADTVGDVADGVAIGAAGLGLITAPTGAGGAFFGGTALIAGGVGRLASGVSVLANLADGNWGGAGSSAAGIVGGHIAGKVVGRVATSAFARNRMFNNLSAGQQRRVDLFSDTGASAGSRVASRAVCP